MAQDPEFRATYNIKTLTYNLCYLNHREAMLNTFLMIYYICFVAHTVTADCYY